MVVRIVGMDYKHAFGLGNACGLASVQGHFVAKIFDHMGTLA